MEGFYNNQKKDDKEKMKRKQSEGSFQSGVSSLASISDHQRHSVVNLSSATDGISGQQNTSLLNHSHSSQGSLLGLKNISVKPLFSLSQEGDYYFYQYFEKRTFNFYVCDYITKPLDEKSSASFQESHHDLLKGILIMSQGIIECAIASLTHN